MPKLCPRCSREMKKALFFGYICIPCMRETIGASRYGECESCSKEFTEPTDENMCEQCNGKTYTIRVQFAHGVEHVFDRVTEDDRLKFIDWVTVHNWVMDFRGHYLNREYMCAMTVKEE